MSLDLKLRIGELRAFCPWMTLKQHMLWKGSVQVRCCPYIHSRLAANRNLRLHAVTSPSTHCTVFEDRSCAPRSGRVAATATITLVTYLTTPFTINSYQWFTLCLFLIQVILSTFSLWCRVCRASYWIPSREHSWYSWKD